MRYALTFVILGLQVALPGQSGTAEKGVLTSIHLAVREKSKQLAATKSGTAVLSRLREIERLVRFSGPVSIGDVSAVLALHDAPAPQVRVEVLRVARSLAPFNRKMVQELLQRVDQSKRDPCVEEIKLFFSVLSACRVDGRGSVDALVAGLRDSNPWCRYTAARAIAVFRWQFVCSWCSPEGPV